MTSQSPPLDRFKLIQALNITANDLLPPAPAMVITMPNGSQISVSKRLSDALRSHAEQTMRPTTAVYSQFALELKNLLNIISD